jgi:hypothetical protein
MPPRSGETCQCSVVSGCWIVRHIERCDGSVFERIWVRGRDAKVVLTEILRTKAPHFHQQYPPLADSGTMWPTLHGWCALLAGRDRQPARMKAPWTRPDLDRLRAVWQAEGIGVSANHVHGFGRFNLQSRAAGSN